LRPPEPGQVRRDGQAGRISPGLNIVSAHTASKIISTVTVLAAGQPAAVALAVVSDALKRPVASSTR
jgi:hypothetical protein